MAISFGSASIWLKIAMVCAGVGMLLFVIGFATTAWMTRHTRYQDVNMGLWEAKTCNRNAGCRTGPYSHINDYHRAIQAMECIGLIGYTLSLATLLLYMCVDSCRRRDFLQAATLFTFAGLLCACIGFAIFGSKDNNENLHRGDIGWSMGVAIGGSILFGVTGIMLLLQLFR